MAADGDRLYVRASGDPQSEWWVDFRQLGEKMQDCRRLQINRQTALDQKVESNGNLKETEKMEKNLQCLEKRVRDGGRRPSIRPLVEVVHGEVKHTETDMNLQEELMQQGPESISQSIIFSVSQLQMPVRAPEHMEAGLEEELLAQAEGSAQTAPDSAGPSGDTSELHQDTRRPEAHPAHTSCTSSNILDPATLSEPISAPAASSEPISAPAASSEPISAPAAPSEPISASAVPSEPMPVVSEKQDASTGAPPAHAGSEIRDLGEALIHVSREGWEDEVRKLLLAGAEVNYADRLGKTPLMLAAWNGHFYVVVLLLYCGADVNAVTKAGFTPLHFAAMCDRNGHCVPTLLHAGANKESRDGFGRTPLHLAVIFDNEIAAYQLIKGGASKDSTDSTGKTPYDLTENDLLRHILRP